MPFPQNCKADVGEVPWDRPHRPAKPNTSNIFKLDHFIRLFALTVLLAAPFNPATATDKINRFRDLMVDPPTLQCLGFRWYIYGDDNGNATGALSYRKVGEDQWHPALPMLRVNREVANWDFHPYASENLLAGSIFSLAPDTAYEVRCRIDDSDGGSADTTLVVHTRPVPQIPAPQRTLHLYQPGYKAPKGPRIYTSLRQAMAHLRPGDEILVHSGVHHSGGDSLKISAGATPEAPIVFRAAGDGKAFIDGGGAEMIFDLRNADHVYFEDLIIRNGNIALRADGASWLVVRRCRIADVRTGIYSYSEKSTNWYIADNVIEGRNENWYPRTDDNASHTGINLYGRGHVVCYNRISKFWDCLAIANYGKPSHDLALQAVAIDFYNNELFDAVDDAVESDYGCHNVRVYDNAIRNVHTGLSAQPTYGGPVYFVRNLVYNATALSLKLHNWCTGLEIYHNTLVSASQAFQSYPRWQNAVLRNNLFLGVSRYAVETGSPHPATSLDYNGYRHSDDPERFIKWISATGEDRCATLAEFYAATGFEGHGTLIDFDIFSNAQPPKEGHTYKADFDHLQLKPDAVAIDAGVPLPNINDGYTGAAPDLGCFEAGQALPRYGPRTR